MESHCTLGWMEQGSGNYIGFLCEKKVNQIVLVLLKSVKSWDSKTDPIPSLYVFEGIELELALKLASREGEEPLGSDFSCPIKLHGGEVHKLPPASQPSCSGVSRISACAFPLIVHLSAFLCPLYEHRLYSLCNPAAPTTITNKIFPFPCPGAVDSHMSVSSTTRSPGVFIPPKWDIETLSVLVLH